MPKFCENCGAPLDAGDKFCIMCGTAVPADEVVAPAPAPAVSAQAPSPAPAVMPAVAPVQAPAPVQPATAAVPAPIFDPKDVGPTTAGAEPAAASAPAPEEQPSTDSTTVLSGEGDSPTTVLSADKLPDAPKLPKTWMTRVIGNKDCPVVRSPFVFGKSFRADYRVTGNSAVSNKHLRLDYSDGQWLASDLGSTNGTFIDNLRIDPQKPVPLADGTHLFLGNEEFVFHCA